MEISKRTSRLLQFVALAVLILIATLLVTCDNQSDSQTGSEQESISEPNQDSEPLLRHDYQSLELRSVIWTQELFRESPSYRYEEIEIIRSDPTIHVHDNDVVMIMASAQLLNTVIGEGWFWPICVVQGGIYSEIDDLDDCLIREYWYWVPDDEITLSGPTTLGERPIPPFSVGEEVDVSYNFQLRTEPAGSCITPCIYIYGGADTTILAGPTLANGRYWCKIQKTSGTPGWISCEFAKK